MLGETDAHSGDRRRVVSRPLDRGCHCAAAEYPGDERAPSRAPRGGMRVRTLFVTTTLIFSALALTAALAIVDVQWERVRATRSMRSATEALAGTLATIEAVALERGAHNEALLRTEIAA